MGAWVLFYLMVTGSLPWRCDAELARNVRKGCYAIPDTVSEPCADVIRAMLCVRVRDRPTPSGVLEMPFLRVGEPKRVERKQTEHVVSVPRRRKRLAPSDSSPLLRTLQRELTAPVRKLRNARASPVSRSIPHTGMLFSGQEELPPLVKASPICATGLVQVFKKAKELTRAICQGNLSKVLFLGCLCTRTKGLTSLPEWGDLREGGHAHSRKKCLRVNDDNHVSLLTEGLANGAF